MATNARVIDFVKQIVLAQTGSADISTGSTQDQIIEEVIMWTNQFLPELETEADWNFSRANDLSLATATTANSYALSDDDIRKLVINEYRPLCIRQDGSVVSTFKVVNPNNLADPTDYSTDDRVILANGSLIFSRPLTSAEAGGDITGDVIYRLPQLTKTDPTLLDTVIPAQLLVLGVVKNRVLPDQVQGSTTPSFTQKYAALLDQCKAENNATSAVFAQQGDNLSFIGGVGF